jgi:hypothetical protein
MGNQIYFKIAGHVDLDKLNMFSVYTQHLSLIVFEIKDEKYFGGIALFFRQIFKILIPFVLYFKNYKR